MYVCNLVKGVYRIDEKKIIVTKLNGALMHCCCLSSQFVEDKVCWKHIIVEGVAALKNHHLFMIMWIAIKNIAFNLKSMVNVCVFFFCCLHKMQTMHILMHNSMFLFSLWNFFNKISFSFLFYINLSFEWIEETMVCNKCFENKLKCWYNKKKTAIILPFVHQKKKYIASIHITYGNSRFP